MVVESETTARRWTGSSRGHSSQPSSLRCPPFSLRSRLAILAVFGALASACAAVPTTPGTNPLATVEKVDGGIRLVLVPKAVERIGIETTTVREVVVTDGRPSKLVPFSALVYDTVGETFIYTNPAARTYVRHSVDVRTIQGDLVSLAAGPPAGSAIVTVGASQLLGIELGIGS